MNECINEWIMLMQNSLLQDKVDAYRDFKHQTSFLY